MKVWNLKKFFRGDNNLAICIVCSASWMNVTSVIYICVCVRGSFHMLAKDTKRRFSSLRSFYINYTSKGHWTFLLETELSFAFTMSQTDKTVLISAQCDFQSADLRHSFDRPKIIILDALLQSLLIKNVR